MFRMGLSVHHQESKIVHTASGTCHTGSVAAAAPVFDFVFQLNALLVYYIFFIFLYMFRAILCSSSGGCIVYTQHLVLYMSLFLGDRSVQR